MDREVYENPLNIRYASKEMSYLFSDEKKFRTWRKLWITLAECEKKLGLNITDAQIAEMKKYSDDINYEVAEKREKEVRHDVMAHVYAFGSQAKSAMPTIHLGATSCYVTDNADIIVYAEALKTVKSKLVGVMKRLADFALKYKDLPALGFTHLQPAQLTTVGKRTCLYLQDLQLDYENLCYIEDSIRLRGIKGTTGTQASFLSLFDGDHEKVKTLEKMMVEALGFKRAYSVTGQTYTRKFDYTVLSALSAVSQSAYKFAGDLRILQNMKEIEEPFEKNQIGSSAMAYKRNPMRSERICGLARYVMSLPVNAAMTESVQFLERTLDDSANRRIVMAQAFLAVDGILNLYLNISENMVVYQNVIKKHIDAELPFMATEEILMECVKAGGNRQELHEKIRKHSMESARGVKEDGKENDLIERIKGDSAFMAVHSKLDSILDAKNFVGRAPRQTEEYVKTEILPIVQKEGQAFVRSDITV